MLYIFQHICIFVDPLPNIFHSIERIESFIRFRDFRVIRRRDSVNKLFSRLFESQSASTLRMYVWLAVWRRNKVK